LRGDEETPEQQGTDADTTAEETLYSSDTETDEIILRLSDISGSYDSTGQSMATKASASGDTEETFSEWSIEKQHSRAFKRSDDSTDDPSQIYSLASIFSSVKACRDRLSFFAETAKEQDASVSRYQPVSDVTATVIQFETDQGFQNVVMYIPVKNMLLSVTTSSQSTFATDQTETLILEMLSDS